MARPKKTITKSKQIKVHCTRQDKLIIEGRAQKCKLSNSEFLLKAGLGIKITPKLTDEEIQLFLELTKMGSNLNQIAKQLNEHKILGIDALEDLEKFRKVLMKFK